MIASGVGVAGEYGGTVKTWVLLLSVLAILGCTKDKESIQYTESNENKEVGFFEVNCRTMSDYFSKNTIDVSLVEVRQGEKKAHTINDPVKIKSLLSFIQDNSADWCKPKWYTAPSGDTSFTFYNGKQSLISFQVGPNFIYFRWYGKDLNAEKMKTLRNLIQE